MLWNDSGFSSLMAFLRALMSLLFTILMEKTWLASLPWTKQLSSGTGTKDKLGGGTEWMWRWVMEYNRQCTLIDSWSSYNNVDGLISRFKMGKDFPQSSCFWQCIVVEKCLFGYFNAGFWAVPIGMEVLSEHYERKKKVLTSFPPPIL
jgi:hypothetical protein